MQGNVILRASAKIHKNETLIFKDIVIINSKEEKILSVTIDNKLTLYQSHRELCKKSFSKNRLCREYQTNLMILKKSFFLTPQRFSV